MRPAWSVILLTTLIGAAQGLFLIVFALDVLRSPPRDFVVLSSGISLLLLAAGLAASFFHLGHPERAWRAVAMWRTSWLSREVIVLLGLASGLTLAVPVAVLRYPQFAGPLALAAFGAGALAWIVRVATLIRNARLRPKSTLQSAIGIAQPKIAQKAQGFMGGSFNTREFFHGKPKPVLGAVRWLFLALIFPVPAWLLGWGGGSLEVFIAAFVVQFAGLLAERWYFFAEARHPQNLYYQSMA